MNLGVIRICAGKHLLCETTHKYCLVKLWVVEVNFSETVTHAAIKTSPAVSRAKFNSNLSVYGFVDILHSFLLCISEMHHNPSGLAV